MSTIVIFKKTRRFYMKQQLVLPYVAVLSLGLALAQPISGFAEETNTPAQPYYPEQLAQPPGDSTTTPPADDPGDDSPGTTPGTTPCGLYSVQIQKLEDEQSGADIFIGTGTDLSCLSDIVDRAVSERYDELMEDMRNQAPALDSLKDKFKAWEEDRLGIQYPDLDEDIREFITEADEDIAEYCEDLLDDDEGYLDRDCKPVKRQKGQEVCGSLRVRWINSPISLLFGEEKGLESVALVNFPLNPYRKGLWYTWRASADAPLLVYDPQHTGEITDGAQLFGTYTFGGQHTAALHSTSVQGAGPWKNGYAALATLDQNNDGELRGSELTPLALWFDRNQDGRTQSGEVKTLAEAQVTALYYQPDKTDPHTGDIYASAGYERTIDGKKSIGASVDWFADQAASQVELLARYSIAQSVWSSPAAVRQEVHSHGSNNSNSAALPENRALNSFSGLWTWTIAGDKDYGVYRPQGLLTIRENKDGTITGHSYVEAPIKPGKHGLKSYLKSYRLSGRKATLADGQPGIVFDIYDQAGSRTRSEASLAAQNQEMSGRSESVWEAQPDRASSRLSYMWSAKRYYPQKP